MSLIVKCACGQAFRANPELAGKRVRCPACGNPLPIPLPAPTPPAQPQPLAPLPSADDPLGLAGLDLGGPVSQSPLATPAPYRAPARKFSLHVNPRVVLIVAGSLGGVAVLVVAVWAAFRVWGMFGGPEAVFATAKQASQNEEWEKLCSCLTDESRDALAGMTVVAAGLMRGFGQFAALAGPAKVQAAQAKMQPVVDVLNKHGLDDATLKSMPATGLAGGPPSGDRLQQLLAPIKDRNRFVGDVIRAMKQVTNQSMPPPFQSDARLEDLKIDGDTATATMIQTVGGKERREPLKFRKVGISWKIDPGLPGRR